MAAINEPEPSTRVRKQSECFICNRASSNVVFREGEYDAIVCHSCGSIYTNPTPVEGEIDFSEESHPELFYSLSAPFKASWVARFCPPGKLVEVGCGKGFFLAEARKLGYEVIGLEPNPKNRVFAEKEFGLPIEARSLEDHALPSGSFDVVYHCDLLAHFPDPLSALESMKTLLSPGGVLCFEVGLMAGVSHLWYRLIGRVGLGPHLWFFSRKGFEMMLDRAGLEPIKIEYFGLAPRAILTIVSGAFLRRAILPILGLVDRREGFPARKQVIELQERFRNFLRYNVGALMPKIGPQTLLVVARPTRT